MKTLIDGFIQVIGESFPLEELPSGEFSTAKVGPMKFSIRHWDGGLLGNVSYMSATGMMGMMNMETLIISPTKADLPLLSMDTILAMGKFTALAEVYDTTINGFDQTGCLAAKASVAALPDDAPKPNWYDGIRLGCSFRKKTGKADAPEIVQAMKLFLQEYLAVASRTRAIADPEMLQEKIRRTNAYVDGLLEKGGPSP